MIRPELKYGIDESYRWWGRLEGGGLRVICHQHPKPMSTVEIERAVKERGLGAVWDYHPPCPVDYARPTLCGRERRALGEIGTRSKKTIVLWR